MAGEPLDARRTRPRRRKSPRFQACELNLWPPPRFRSWRRLCYSCRRRPRVHATRRGDELPGNAPPGERIRQNRQLTFGGENAEAYFSRDGKRLIFQSTRDGRTCDQQYVMNIDGSQREARLDRRRQDHLRLLLRRRPARSSSARRTRPTRRARRSPIRRRATCGVSIRTTSTPPIPTARVSGASRTTASTPPRARSRPTDKTIVFTSLKDGDLDIYTMNVDGTNLKQLTHPAGLRRRPVLLARRQEDRVPRVAPEPTRRSRTIRICSSSASCGRIEWRSG